MTSREIIGELYTSKELNDCIHKIVRRDHWDDFKQELMVILLSKPPGLIVELYELNKLRFYVVRVILNLANQDGNIYRKLYRDANIVSGDYHLVTAADSPVDLEERIAIEDRELEIANEVRDGLNIKYETFYYRKVVDAVNEYGGIRAASRATGIPKTTIHNAMKKVKEYLNNCYGGEPDKGIY